MQSTKTTIDPRLLKFHRSRREPTDPTELAILNERYNALVPTWPSTP